MFAELRLPPAVTHDRPRDARRSSGARRSLRASTPFDEAGAMEALRAFAPTPSFANATDSRDVPDAIE